MVLFNSQVFTEYLLCTECCAELSHERSKTQHLPKGETPGRGILYVGKEAQALE